MIPWELRGVGSESRAAESEDREGADKRQALLSPPGAKTRAPYHKRYWKVRITMLLFE